MNNQTITAESLISIGFVFEQKPHNVSIEKCYDFKDLTVTLTDRVPDRPQVFMRSEDNCTYFPGVKTMDDLSTLIRLRYA